MSNLYTYHSRNGIGIFEILSEKLNIFNTSEVINTFRSTIEKNNPTAVIVDLKNVTHIDSVGIGFLVAIKSITSKKGCSIHLISNNEVVIKVLKITKMDSFFTIFPTMEDAMRHIEADSSGTKE